jgi:multicomponent Na+:H+ antiporter subunit B
MRAALVVLLVLGLGVVLAVGVGLPGPAPGELSDYVSQRGVEQTGAVNLVSAIYLGYRAFDTLGETVVLLLAVAGIIAIHGAQPAAVTGQEGRPRREAAPLGRAETGRAAARGDSELVEIVSRKLMPFILLFGLYLVSHGHISPGGGFQGGVVLASGLILLCLSREVEVTVRHFPLSRLSLAEIAGFFLILAMGVVGLAVGRGFLGNFLPLGRAGEVPSAGFIFFLNLLIGLKVGAGISLFLFYLLREG